MARATSKAARARNVKTRAAGRKALKGAGAGVRRAAAAGGGRFSPARLRAAGRLAGAARAATAGSSE